MKLEHLFVILCWSIICSSPNARGQDLTDGLVAYYPFNGNADDASGNGINGNVNGPTLTEDRNGNPNSAYRFDRTQAQHIILPDAEPIRQLGENYSFSFWVSTEDTTQDAYIISKDVHAASADQWAILLGYRDEKITLSLGARPNDEVHSSRFNANRWEHFAITHEGSSLKLFRNGVLDVISSVNLPLPAAVGRGVRFGGPRGTSLSHFTGQLDDIRIYNRALSAEEVRELYGLERPALTLNDGLVAYYPFNGNADDESGNGHNGTVNGATLTTDRLGTPNSAYDFDGNNDYIEVASSPELRTLSSLSVSTWIQVDSSQSPAPNGYNQILSSWGGGGDGRAWSIGTGGGGSHLAVDSGPDDPHGSLFNAPQTPPIEHGVWFHVVYTHGSNGATLYLNGNAIVDTGVSFDLNPFIEPLIFGADNRGVRAHFRGFIDDTRIYNRALSAEEVSELYDLEKPSGGQLPQYALIREWHTWQGARDEAELMGGRLAVIDTPEKQALIETLVEQWGGTDVWDTDSIWIGLSDLDGDGTWNWVDGSPVTWDNWANPGAPNSGRRLGAYNANLQWFASTSVTKYYIIEYPSNEELTLENGLVAYYPFNGNADDESGNGNDGTVNDATLTTDRDGNTDSALLITTGEGSVTSAANIPISGNADRTISFWCKFSSPTDPGFAAVRWGSTSRAGGMCRFSELHQDPRPPGNWLHFWGHNADNTYPPSGAPYDQWRHLVFVYHSSINDAVCYANGIVVPLQSQSPHNHTTTLNTISTPLEIHGRSFIDDVRIYDRALSEEDVAALYELEKPRPTPPGLEIAAYLESDPGEPLTVDATPISGSPTDFTYQWYLDGVAVPAAFGGTGSSVTFDGVLTDEGSWRVVVTNAAGSAEATFDYRVFVDTDGDGLSDGYEALFSLTDPFDADTDRDWLNDGSEVLELGTDPLLADTDGDGFDDYYELRNRFDPISPASTPESVATVFPTGDLQFIEFRFNTAKGLHYRVESSTDLTNWATEETGITGRGGPVYRYFSTENRPRAFFRARRE